MLWELGLMDDFFTFMYIIYIVCGSYYAGRTAPKIDDDETLRRLLKCIFFWPFLLYKNRKKS